MSPILSRPWVPEYNTPRTSTSTTRRSSLSSSLIKKVTHRQEETPQSSTTMIGQSSIDCQEETPHTSTSTIRRLSISNFAIIDKKSNRRSSITSTSTAGSKSSVSTASSRQSSTSSTTREISKELFRKKYSQLTLGQRHKVDFERAQEQRRQREEDREWRKNNPSPYDPDPRAYLRYGYESWYESGSESGKEEFDPSEEPKLVGFGGSVEGEEDKDEKFKREMLLEPNWVKVMKRKEMPKAKKIMVSLKKLLRLEKQEKKEASKVAHVEKVVKKEGWGCSKIIEAIRAPKSRKNSLKEIFEQIPTVSLECDRWTL